MDTASALGAAAQPRAATPPAPTDGAGEGASRPPTDGRNRRRSRNREAVVDAMLSLYREGEIWPSTDQIADRAGVSARSLFRYFADIDDLSREAVARQQHHLAPLWVCEVDPAEPLADRITTFVDARWRLLEGMGEVARAARVRATQQPTVAEEVARVRSALRAQVLAAFAPELDPLPAAERTAVLAALDVLTSWEAHDLMLHDQSLTPVQARGATALALRRLLAPTEPPGASASTEPKGGRRR